MPKLERSLRVEAVVLRHSDWGEADRLLTLFTREAGILRALAKGARKPRSRKAGHIEPFTRVDLMLARGKDLWIVTQAETVESFQALREDLMRTGYASYAVELVDRFSYEEGENRSLYRLLMETLQRVAQLPDGFLPIRYFEIRLLDEVGFRPQLFHCVTCGEEIKPEPQYFSAQLGGALCPKCGPRAAEARAVSVETLKYMRHFQRSGYANASRAVLAPAVRAEMESLLQYYLTWLLERGLNSPSFLREVRKSGNGV